MSIQVFIYFHTPPKNIIPTTKGLDEKETADFELEEGWKFTIYIVHNNINTLSTIMIGDYFTMLKFASLI